jgi:hypothetical protein
MSEQEILHRADGASATALGSARVSRVGERVLAGRELFLEAQDTQLSEIQEKFVSATTLKPARETRALPRIIVNAKWNQPDKQLRF